jgi:subtilisin family serine protease
MKRVVAVLSLALAPILGLGGPAAASPATASPAAAGSPASRPARPGTRPMVSAIVVLKDQVDAGPVRAATLRQRHTAVEQALRATAAASQRGILALLHRRRLEGLVAASDPLWIVNAVAVTAVPSVIVELAGRADVRRVDADLAIQAPPKPAPTALAAGPPESNVDKVNAPALWDLGYRGQGVVVASMDTGVDATHPDLAGRWRGGTNSWYDPNGEHPSTPTDVNGHGTATMGVMVGGDAGGTSIGLAPEARWIAVKIFNDRGVASSTAVHRGFQWLLDPDGNPATADAPDVVNNSWTMSAAGCILDFQTDLRNLRAAGILPVFSAGNYGPTPGTVFSPANNPEAFAVGATDNADALDESSSRGPSACGPAPTPQLVSPGVNIHTTDLYGFYTDASGTSLAAPHVAGALALLLSAFPDLPADRQAAALQAGAVDLGTPGPDNDSGYGRLDVLAAYRWLATTPDFGIAVSPSTATTAPGGTVDYTVAVTASNGFTADVGLAVSGLPVGASAGFAPSTVVAGAGSATLTVSTTASIAPGTYPLTVTGTGAATSHSATATLVVPAPPDFAIMATPAAGSVSAGATTTYTVSVSALGGFTGTVTLDLSGLPSTVGSAAFAPASVTAAGSSQLTVTTLASAPSGTFPLTIHGTDGSTEHSVTVSLAVSAQDFTLAVSPSAISLLRGQTATYTVSVGGRNGFTGTVTLSVTGLPAGATATFSPNPVAAPNTSTLRVRTATWTPRGSFALRLTGTSGTLSHESKITLTIR